MAFTKATRVSRSLSVDLSTDSMGVASSSDVSPAADAVVPDVSPAADAVVPDVSSLLPPQPASTVHKIQIGISNFAVKEEVMV